MVASGFGVLRPEPSLGVAAFEEVKEALAPLWVTIMGLRGECFLRKMGWTFCFEVIGVR